MLHNKEEKEFHSQMSLASTAYYSLLQIHSHNNKLKALRILIGRKNPPHSLTLLNLPLLNLFG